MSVFEMLTLFAIFGCVCGFYLSVVGFAVTSLAIAIMLGLINPLFGGPFTPGFLVLAFVTQQVAYGLAVAGRSIAHHHARRREAPPVSIDDRQAGLPAERDQSRYR